MTARGTQVAPARVAQLRRPSNQNVVARYVATAVRCQTAPTPPTGSLWVGRDRGGPFITSDPDTASSHSTMLYEVTTDGDVFRVLP